ncbi:MAG: uroporphyrinogen decarboxylase family protein, partial [bacterium]
LHKIMDFHIGIARHYLACGIELAFCGDDLGTQTTPLLNPTLVHEFLEPEYERLFSLYRQHDVIIHFHSCGHIEEFLDMFMRLGVRILNPIQVKANDLELIRRVTNGRITLNGGISTVTLMEGPVEAIQQEVRQRMWQLGRGGGYICKPDQGMPWSPENYQAYRDTVADYGRYPLLEATAKS